MMIILKNIPTKITRNDISNFIGPVIKGGFLSRSGQVKNISIFSQKNIRTHDVQRHCLVEIAPDFVAERVIKKLNRKIMGGRCIAISEYRVRDWHNDPRLNWDNLRHQIKNKRICDRRDQYEELISDGIGVVGKEIFHTKGWQ